MCKLATLKKLIVIFLLFNFVGALAQKDTLPYDRKREIVYDGKRYRKYNNYLTFGVGKAYSTVRKIDQSLIGVDFQFHLMKEYFQVGFFMSGDRLLANNNIQGHVAYGLRIEKNKINFAAFIGPSYSYFVTASAPDTAGKTYPIINKTLGGYVCGQFIYKFKYDVGIGIELFADISPLQQMYGGRLVIYFSGAYRGEKRGFKTTKSK